MQATQITIIGGGFCGIMTAVHLLRNREAPLDIHIINKDNPLAKGVAYNPHTASLLLNVPNGKISAFDDMPDHFTNWLINEQPELAGIDNISELFATRQQYGRYLVHAWNEALANKPNHITVTTYDDEALDIVQEVDCFHIILKQHPVLIADFVVLATGNVIPALPAGLPAAFGNSKRYFGNPWKKACVEIQDPKTDVLIIGNGLTMVDTVIGLVEHGFKCNIHTISPNGYQLKPASDANPSYPDADIKALMQNKPSLLTIVSYLNKHRKIAVDSNRSFLPVIDAFRPYSQQTWQRLSFGEKKRFLKYFSNAWNTVRHRLPVMMYAFMEKMQTEKRLFTNRGGIISINETNNKVIVTLNCGGEIRTLGVQSVINCTGPGSNLSKSANKLLRNIASKALICPDALNMGINADPETGMVITADGCCNPNLYAIGGNLKGMLWESTAVPELRTQAKMLAAHLLKKCRYSWQLNPVA